MKGLLSFTFLPIFLLSIILTDNKKEDETFRNNNSCYYFKANDSNKIKFVENYSQITSISELLDSFKKANPFFLTFGQLGVAHV